jgi:hypothetical protein
MSALPLEADIARRGHQRPLSARSGRDACGEKVEEDRAVEVADPGRHLKLVATEEWLAPVAAPIDEPVLSRIL